MAATSDFDFGTEPAPPPAIVVPPTPSGGGGGAGGGSGGSQAGSNKKLVQELACVTKESTRNPDLGDLFLSEAGDAVALSDMMRATAQRLRVRFSFFAGEWFMNRNAGTPWFQHIFIKAPQDAVVRTILTQVIRDCPGVSTIERLTYSISSRRVMTVNFKARLINGELLISTDYPPFVISLDNLSSSPG